MRSIRSVRGILALAALLSVTGTSVADAPKKNSAEPKPLRTWTKLPDAVTSLAFSKDGKTVWLGMYEELRKQPLDAGKPAQPIRVSTGFVKSIGVAPDGVTIAAGHYQALSLIDASTGSVRHTFHEPAGYVTGLSFSPDGKRLAAACDDETATIYDVGTSKVLRTLKHAYPVQGIAYSPDGKLIATASGDETRVTKHGEVKLWDADSGEEIFSSDAPRQAATAVVFSPDGKLLASAGYDKRVILFDVAAKKGASVFEEHGRPTTCLAFSPDGKLIVSGSGGRSKGRNELKIWERETGREFASLEPHEGIITALALSADGKTLVTGGQDKTAFAWDFRALADNAESGDKRPEVAAKGPRQVDDSRRLNAAVAEAKAGKKAVIRLGVIGLDTSHAGAFAKAFNDPKAASDVAGFRVVAAYPKGSPDIVSSTSRVADYTKDFQNMDIEIVDSIDDLLTKVDAVLLETNDGRPHFEQAIPVMKAGKPLFIDKPIAGSLADAIAIFEAAKKYGVPVFSSSSLRYGKTTQQARAGAVGKIMEAETHSPASLEPTHPDLFWYGIHGVESLFTVMGTGCQSVKRTKSTETEETVVGTWAGGRKGTYFGSRSKGRYGGFAVGERGKMNVGDSEGYRPLVVAIAEFFKTGKPPVSEQETLEIYAFMEAADESKRQGGKEVTLDSVMHKARAEAAKKIAALK